MKNFYVGEGIPGAEAELQQAMLITCLGLDNKPLAEQILGIAGAEMTAWLYDETDPVPNYLCWRQNNSTGVVCYGIQGLPQGFWCLGGWVFQADPNNEGVYRNRFMHHMWSDVYKNIHKIIGVTSANGRILMSGYSFGGGCVTIGSVELQRRYPGQVQLMTFGAPKSYHETQAVVFPKFPIIIANEHDPVPYLPPELPFGVQQLAKLTPFVAAIGKRWKHIGPIWIQQDDGSLFVLPDYALPYFTIEEVTNLHLDDHAPQAYLSRIVTFCKTIPLSPSGQQLLPIAEMLAAT